MTLAFVQTGPGWVWGGTCVRCADAGRSVRGSCSSRPEQEQDPRTLGPATRPVHAAQVRQRRLDVPQPGPDRPREVCTNASVIRACAASWVEPHRRARAIASRRCLIAVSTSSLW